MPASGAVQWIALKASKKAVRIADNLVTSPRMAGLKNEG
jgi:hypothetical protein